MSVVEVTYYTDPVCPWSWGLEPAMRKLSEDFAGEVRFTYVMCGRSANWKAEPRRTMRRSRSSPHRSRPLRGR
jgi:protein-disulfide isomerase-like protein with CxxC motif